MSCIQNSLSHSNVETRASEGIAPFDALKARCARLPATLNFDRLDPPNSHSYHYIDEGLWENHIARQKDASVSVWNKHQEALKHQESGKTFQSLDELCEEELGKRYPEGCKISRTQHFLERHFSYFLRAVYGHASYFTEKAKAKLKKEISYSGCNRDDLHSRIHIIDPELRKALQITTDDTLSTVHTCSKNSPLNGLSYKNESGEVIHLSSAITTPRDTKGPFVGSLRSVKTKEGKPIAYSGRAETLAKAEEQARFIFLEQLKSQPGSLRTSKTQEGETIYEMDYVINSVLATSFLMKKKLPPISSFPERKYLDEQIKALQALREKGPIIITDPENGRTYKVRCQPILFSDVFNSMLKLHESLPSFITGDAYSENICREGFQQLQQLIESKIKNLQNELSQTPDTDPKALELQQRIKEIKKVNDLLLSKTDLQPEEKVFYRDYLCKLLDLPLLYHCKSSTDRTGILLALSCAIRQWMDLKLEMPEDPKDILQDFRFKELFAANLMTGHQITRFSHGAKGSINGENLCPHELGYRFYKGLFQNPLVQRLIPERYLKSYPLINKITAAIPLIVGHIICLPFLALITIVRLGIYLATGCRHKEYLPSFKGSFFAIPYHILRGSLRWIPDKTLNEDSPQVGGRRLIATKSSKCPVFQSQCLNKTLEKATGVLPSFKAAKNAEEYRQALEHFKRHVGEKTVKALSTLSPSLPESFAEIRRKLIANSHYDFSKDLKNIRKGIFHSLHADIVRSTLEFGNRQIIVNGHSYGLSKTVTDVKLREKLAEEQVNEIYHQIKDYFLAINPELAHPDRILDLEEKIFSVFDNLHQGAVMILLTALKKEFECDSVLLLNNNSYKIELQLDPNEVLSDGTKGSILLRRRFIVDAVNLKRAERRSAQNPFDHFDKWGLQKYSAKDCQAEGVFFAESLEEFKPSQELSIRLGAI